MMLGRALVANGDVEEGRRLLREGHAAWTDAGARATGTEYASHAAEVLLNAGLPTRLANYVRAGEKLIGEIGERISRPSCCANAAGRRGRRARRRRRNGWRSARSGPGADGRPSRHPPHRRALLPSALDVAEAQAPVFTLRAASDLARLLKHEGRHAEADAVLRPVYAAFTEGFDYPDLRRARALLT